MSLILSWRRPAPPITVAWRLPDAASMGGLITDPPQPLTNLVGPVGPPGPSGAQGPTFDLSAAQIDGGTFN